MPNSEQAAWFYSQRPVHHEGARPGLRCLARCKDARAGHRHRTCPRVSPCFPCPLLILGAVWDLSVGMTVLLVQGEVAPRHNVTPR